MDKEKQADYHGRIMNIQIAVGEQVSAINQAMERNKLSDKIIYAYKLGHRDARHHAAEIANDADAEIARLKEDRDLWKESERKANDYSKELLAEIASLKDQAEEQQHVIDHLGFDIDHLKDEIHECKLENSRLIVALGNIEAEIERKVIDAYISGYECGHNDTVESCYGSAEDKAQDYLIEALSNDEDK